nr:immunoglobulin light chain junction region [Macaca mulatta]MOX29618.1 immunoglobulin light chain junction region [Macaca mulatta]
DYYCSIWHTSAYFF